MLVGLHGLLHNLSRSATLLFQRELHPRGEIANRIYRILFAREFVAFHQKPINTERARGSTARG